MTTKKKVAKKKTSKKVTRKKVAKKKTSKSSRVPKILPGEIEENILYTGDTTGILMNCSKIKAYHTLGAGRAVGFMEYGSNRGMEFQVLCLGSTKKNQPISIDNAKSQLLILGYYSLDDLIEDVPKKTIEKINRKLAKKYNLTTGKD